MDIYGYTGATGSFTHNVKIARDFTYNIIPALQWKQLSSGNYRATDRGFASDIYESEIKIYDTLAKLCEIAKDLYNVRYTDGHIILVCAPGEEIFSKSIIYSPSIKVAVISIGNPEKSSMNLYTLQVKLRLSYVSLQLATDIVAVVPSMWRIESYSSQTTNTSIVTDDYGSYFYVVDPNKDYGTFTANFVFKNDELQALQRWYAINRGSTATISKIYGVPFIFGPRSYNESSVEYACYPATVKFISMSSFKYYSYNYTTAQITLAEEI
jgi:hypothetical protein